MADLVPSDIPAETIAADDEAYLLARDLVIQPDAITVIIRDKDGNYHTNCHAVGPGANPGTVPGIPVRAAISIPVFGMAIGAGMGTLMGKLTKNSIDKQFPGLGPGSGQLPCRKRAQVQGSHRVNR